MVFTKLCTLNDLMAVKSISDANVRKKMLGIEVNSEALERRAKVRAKVSKVVSFSNKC